VCIIRTSCAMCALGQDVRCVHNDKMCDVCIIRTRCAMCALGQEVRCVH